MNNPRTREKFLVYRRKYLSSREVSPIEVCYRIRRHDPADKSLVGIPPDIYFSSYVESELAEDGADDTGDGMDRGPRADIHVNIATSLCSGTMGISTEEMRLE